MIIKKQAEPLANTENTFLFASNLRKLLRDKAKSIRENRFKVAKYPEISYLPLNNGHQSKMQSFNSMLHRVTNSIKQDFKKKSAKKRESGNKSEIIGNTFIIERIKPNKTTSIAENLGEGPRNRVAYSSKELRGHNITKFNLFTKKGFSDKKIVYEPEDEQKLKRRDQKIDIGNSSKKNSHKNDLSKICKGSSFSRPKNSVKVLTQGNIFDQSGINSGQENQKIKKCKTHFDDHKEDHHENNQFRPIGRVSMENSQRGNLESNRFEIDSMFEISSPHCDHEDSEPLRQVYDKIFIQKGDGNSKTMRKPQHNKYDQKEFDAYYSYYNKFYESRKERKNEERKLQTQEKVRRKIVSQEKFEVNAGREKEKKHDDLLGPWG